MSRKISVIVPVYNTDETYLQNCINSILSQSHQDIELILINDGSTNGAPLLCQNAAQNDSRVLYLTQENAGVSVARNNGLDHATGEYVIFCDGDDFLSDGIIKTLVSAVDNDASMADKDIIFFGYVTSYTNREISRVLNSPDMSVFKPEALELAILRGDKRLGPVEVGAPWGKFIKRSVIENGNIRFTPGLRKGQDTVFSLHLLSRCKSASYLPVAGYHYRMSTQSISHRFNPEIVDIMEKTLNAYQGFVDSENKDEEFKDAVKRKYFGVLCGEYIELYLGNKNNPDSFSKRAKQFGALADKEPYSSVINSLDISNMKGLSALELRLIRKKHIKLLFLEKALLSFAKRLIIKNYD